MKMLGLATLILALPSIAQAPNYYTTTDELRAILETYPNYPLAVAVGKGYKASPVRLDVRCMTLDQRRDWYDAHQSRGCTPVVVLSETTSAELLDGQ